MHRYVYGCLLSAVLVAHAAQPQKPSDANIQYVLDLLAEPLPDNSFNPPLPHRYTDWTEQQRARVPQQMGGRCGVLWGMMNDGGKIQLLPHDLEDQTVTLIGDLCVSGKMPRDWPLRPQTIEKARVILQKATELGEPLHLPESLTH